MQHDSKNTHGHFSYLYDEVSPLGAEVVGLERVGDVGAVQHQLHHEHTVLVVAHALDHVFAARAESLSVLPVHLQEHLQNKEGNTERKHDDITIRADLSQKCPILQTDWKKHC